MAAEVPNQATVRASDERLIGRLAARRGDGGPERLWNGEVVVDAADGLHPASVAVAEAISIDGLRAAGVGDAEAGDGYVPLGAESWRHTCGPQQLVADVVQHEFMDFRQLRQRRIGARVDAGDELQLRFAEVHGDVRVGQRRTERRRMHGPRQRAAVRDAQVLLLDAAPQRREFRAIPHRGQRGRQRIARQGAARQRVGDYGRGPARTMISSTSKRPKLSMNFAVKALRAWS